MSKRHNRKYGISRRLGVNLWGRPNDPVNTRNCPPGSHGRMGYKKPTDYGVQLQAKQKLRKYYGDITEKQFHGIYKEAARRTGDTGHNLIGLLESRLDAFVYRSLFVSTIFAARQLVNHKHVKVNGKTVNIASYRLKAGDIVEIRDKSKNMQVIQNSLASNERSIPSYIEVDRDKMSAKYSRVPDLNDVPYPVQMEPHLVTEFYSR